MGFVPILLLAVTVADLKAGEGVNCGVNKKPFVASGRCFRVCYPSAWRLYGHGDSRPTLDIINFGPQKKVSDVFLPGGGAEIVVAPLPPELSNLSRWLAVRARDDTEPTVARVRINENEPARAVVREYTEAKWYSEIGPGTNITKQAAHFKVGEQSFEAQVSYWKTDPSGAQHSSALKRILRTFRTGNDGSCK